MEPKAQRVESRAMENYSQALKLIKELLTFARLDCRIAMDK
jgi:hypothetical protein